MLPALETIVEFIHRSSVDANRSEEVIKSAVGLLGDLGQSFGAKMLPVFEQPWTSQLIKHALQAGINAEEVANWAHSVSSWFYFAIILVGVLKVVFPSCRSRCPFCERLASKASMLRAQ